MLKGLPDFMDPELLWVLAAMGHGDVLALVDRNFPARAVAEATVSGRLVTLPGLDAPTAAQGILQLLPLDTFIPSPLSWMDPVDRPGTVLEVHRLVLETCRRAEGREVVATPVKRHDFYQAARQAFAVVQTTEHRPYGCFLLVKGVVFDP